jgi:serine/threonine protein phosphatase PrpC
VAAGELLRAAARTHPGRVRLNNEDLPLIDATRGIFGVIDGIGGQAGGEVAAATARDVILQRLARPLGTPAERVREAIALANNAIQRRAQESSELRGMACVITLALVSPGRLTIGHVGDSRLYKIRSDGLRKLTHDHSPVGEREDAGDLMEADAMRHPRRHEVFRDVGSIYRDKDEREFVDIVDESLEPDSAILICSDGLTDMLPSSTIAHIVSQHTGNPERVVEALVAAANDAGGRDNITVVYAEMPQFASGATARDDQTPTEPLAGDEAAALPGDAPAARSARGGRVRRAVRAVISSRATWFAVGTLAGVVGALLLTLYIARTQAPPPQTLIVDTEGGGRFSSVMAAMAAARSGDVVRVEPGVYRERVQVRDGVDLVARVPGSVAVRRPESLDRATPAVTIAGGLNVRISGIRIESVLEAPADLAIRIACPVASLDLVEITGAFRQAIGLAQSSSVRLSGSRVSVTGAVISLPDDAQATFVNSILARSGPSEGPPIVSSHSSHLVLRGNVFSGYGTEIVKGVSDTRRKELLSGNLVVAPDGDRGRGLNRSR